MCTSAGWDVVFWTGRKRPWRVTSRGSPGDSAGLRADGVMASDTGLDVVTRHCSQTEAPGHFLQFLIWNIGSGAPASAF